MRISGTTNVYAASRIVAHKTDGAINNIQKQIQRVQEEIADLSENKSLSNKEKMTKRQELEKNIAELNNQLMQMQMDQKKLENEKPTNKIENQAEEVVSKNQRDRNDIGISNKSMEAIISVSTSMETAKTMNYVRTQMNGNARLLNREISVIESKGGDVTDLKSKLSDLQSKLGDVTKNIIKEYTDADEDTQGAEKSVIEQAKNQKTDKKEEKEDNKTIDVYA